MAKTQKFSVRGTTCDSCEVVIERQVKQLDGVIGVDASHKQGIVSVTTKKGCTLSKEDLQPILKEHGYTLSDHKEPSGTSDWNWKKIGLYALIIWITYKILSATGFLTYSPTIEQSSGYLGVFAIGVIASLSSCTAVLSGLVVAVSASAAKAKAHLTREERLRPHVLFNLGRLIGFLFFGAIIGWIGSALQLSLTFNGLLILIVALVMIGIGVNLLDVIPARTTFLKPPKWLSHKIHDLSSSHHPGVPFVLGALTFFLPCGFTQAMQLYALSLGDPLSSGVLMAIFALGTVPALLGIGAFTSSAAGTKLKKITAIAGVLVVTLGISNVQNAFALLDWNPLSFASSGYEIDYSAVSIFDGKQYIQMEISERGVYLPNTLTVVEDIPVQWDIYGADFMGCADTLVMRQFGVNTYLKSGPNTVEFTPTKTGQFTFSCSMGMIRGTMNVIPQE
jgi:sulfite exporter TauE/SafE/copper chaperone CopZ